MITMAHADECADDDENDDFFYFSRALCPEGVLLRGLDSLASASLVVVAVPR